MVMGTGMIVVGSLELEEESEGVSEVVSEWVEESGGVSSGKPLGADDEWQWVNKKSAFNATINPKGNRVMWSPNRCVSVLNDNEGQRG